MNKYKVGDRFLVRVDKVLHGKHALGEFTNYIICAETPEDRGDIAPIDGCVVTEEFLDQCSPYDTIQYSGLIETDRLLPCPFCGCEMKLRRETMCDGRTIRYIPFGYHEHGCQLRFASNAFVGNPTTIGGAIQKWNRRTYIEAVPDMGEVSDGYHTFNELYHHRAVLFSVICNQNKELAWKSKKHADGSMFDDMFIVGIETPDGQATYHYDIEPYWDMFHVKELECAPEWDGHTPSEAIERISKIGLGELNEREN